MRAHARAHAHTHRSASLLALQTLQNKSGSVAVIQSLQIGLLKLCVGAMQLLCLGEEKVS